MSKRSINNRNSTASKSKEAGRAEIQFVKGDQEISKILKEYLREIDTAHATKRATEHTYRPMLKSLIESLAVGVTAINEPKRIECGAPDLSVMHGETPLGYVEAKDIGVSLDKAEVSEQLERYRESLGNLILTDYLEFRWYVRGKMQGWARLANIEADGRLSPDEAGFEQVGRLLMRFLRADVPTIESPEQLAKSMAALVREIQHAILRALRKESSQGMLHQQMISFRDVLIHDLTADEFADMYAQTICFGLFAARCNARGTERFTRRHAAYDLPKTNPFLRNLFQHIAGPDLDDEPHVWAVDYLAELLNRANIGKILEGFGKRSRREDPVFHFYETFLAEYNPALREQRGVYYTPEPVVSYIVRSVDHILREDFSLADGLADRSQISVKSLDGDGEFNVHRVLILDPATGTGTFLHGVVNHIFDLFKRNRGMWASYVSEHLLPRLFGFELLMAPYAVAHLKLGLQLRDMGYDLEQDERLHVYLTNTLEEAQEANSRLPFAQWLAEEANAANRVKQEEPVMVVLGNPPYSGHSINTGAWIAGLLRGFDTQTGEQTGNYFAVDGKPLGERNPKWLNDDYVKFIRFAQWRIEQTGYGVLAFITNHGYLDNPTFRGMRQSLMETFDDIYVLDLHGNAKKKERAPDGSEDKNVFDIQQGVAIGIFVKRQGEKSELATVRRADLWGLREVYEENGDEERALVGGKYEWLEHHDVTTTQWKAIKPEWPFYLFIEQNPLIKTEYEQGWLVNKAMPVNGWGIATRKDYLLVDFSREVMIERFEDIRLLPVEEAIDKYGIKESPHWDFKRAKKQLSPYTEKHVKPILFRPFDKRFIYYEKIMIERGDHRFDLMAHLFQANLSLISVRRTEAAGTPAHFYCTDLISVLHSISAKEGNFVFPLYLYPNNSRASLFDKDEPTDTLGGRRANLATEFVEDFAARLDLSFIAGGKGDLVKTFGPEDVFNYMYAVFHSPTYRSRYAEFLKADFPRLPLTRNRELFRELCQTGEELVALHLMKKRGPEITSYPINGDNVVERVQYEPLVPGIQQGRVYINKRQYFEGVPPEVWDFHIGGYRVSERWLKDRKAPKKNHLTFDDLEHYRRVVSAIAETIRLMAEIDAMIEEHGGWPLDANSA